MKKWWAEFEPILRSKTIQPFAEKHLSEELGHLLLGEITSGLLEELFNKLKAVLSPQSCNHLRSYVKRAYNYAARRDLWRGVNPASTLKKMKVPKKKPHYLRPDEIGRVLLKLDNRWVPLFATAFFTLHRDEKRRASGVEEDRRRFDERHHHGQAPEQLRHHEG